MKWMVSLFVIMCLSVTFGIGYRTGESKVLKEYLELLMETDQTDSTNTLISRDGTRYGIIKIDEEGN